MHAQRKGGNEAVRKLHPHGKDGSCRKTLLTPGSRASRLWDPKQTCKQICPHCLNHQLCSTLLRGKKWTMFSYQGKFPAKDEWHLERGLKETEFDVDSKRKLTVALRKQINQWKSILYPWRRRAGRGCAIKAGPLMALKAPGRFSVEEHKEKILEWMVIIWYLKWDGLMGRKRNAWRKAGRS